jgi:hypothetical protein
MHGDYDVTLTDEEKEHVERHQMDTDFYLRLGFDKVARNMGLTKLELEEVMFKVPRVMSRIDWTEFDWDMYRRVRDGTEKILAAINGSQVSVQLGSEQAEVTLGELRQALRLRHDELEQEKLDLLDSGGGHAEIQNLEQQLEELSSIHVGTTLLLTDAEDEHVARINALLENDATFKDLLTDCHEATALNETAKQNQGSPSNSLKF